MLFSMWCLCHHGAIFFTINIIVIALLLALWCICYCGVIAIAGFCAKQLCAKAQNCFD